MTHEDFSRGERNPLGPPGPAGPPVLRKTVAKTETAVREGPGSPFLPGGPAALGCPLRAPECPRRSLLRKWKAQ
jgi:hypothetical protein